MTRIMRCTVFFYLILAVFLLVATDTEAAAPARIGPHLTAALGRATGESPLIVWISFTDKGPRVLEKQLQPLRLVAEASLRRRANVASPGGLVDETDVPVSEDYVAALVARGVRIRHHSRWLNAVSGELTPAQVEEVRQLPFVAEVELVARFPMRKAEPLPPAAAPSPLLKESSTNQLPYGPSLQQLAVINVPPVHERGNFAQGVIIGHFDNGVRLLQHQAFDSLKVIATYDFVDYKTSVVPLAPTQGQHGVTTLSALAGYRAGQLIGPAFAASYVLARTENDSSETPFEEDKWVAGIEWADSIGVQVTSTSLGYLDYDQPYTSWTWEDMNGRTTRITKAAAMAVRKGIVVVNAAGNNGFNAVHNTLDAPADADSVLTVGAAFMTGGRAGFSSVGPTTSIPPRIKPDIMAPGVAVYSASAFDTSGYVTASGTSLATPLAAGAVALLIREFPNAAPMTIVDALKKTASNASTPDNLNGWGMVNTAAALLYLGRVQSPPTSFALVQNYPNPFNERTTITFDLKEPAHVQVRVYDLLGHTVATVFDGQLSPPGFPIVWLPRNDRGRSLASGIYICRMTATGASGKTYTGQVKMLMVK